MSFYTAVKVTVHYRNWRRAREPSSAAEWHSSLKERHRWPLRRCCNRHSTIKVLWIHSAEQVRGYIHVVTLPHQRSSLYVNMLRAVANNTFVVALLPWIRGAVTWLDLLSNDVARVLRGLSVKIKNMAVGLKVTIHLYDNSANCSKCQVNKFWSKSVTTTT